MNIGIDIDNTIYDTNKTFKKYLDLYLKNNNIDYFSWYTDESYRTDFYQKYMKIINNEAALINGSVDKIRELSKNYNIYIITNRSEKYISLEELKNKLKSDGINYVDVYMIDGSKVNICKNLNIYIFIDDDELIINDLEKNGIKTVLFNKEKGWNSLEIPIN